MSNCKTIRLSYLHNNLGFFSAQPGSDFWPIQLSVPATSGLADLGAATTRGDGPLDDAVCPSGDVDGDDAGGAADDGGDGVGDGAIGDGSFAVAVAALPVAAPVTTEWEKSNRFEDSSLFCTGTSTREGSPGY